MKPFFVPCLLLLLAAQAPSPGPHPVAITHVTIIDVTGGPSQPNMTVIVSGDRVAEMGKSSAVQTPRDAQVVDATGKFLIPGLWDMHVHWSDTDYLPLFLANGVTGVRIMWGTPIHQQWRAQSADGTLLAPRLVIASKIIDGPKPYWPSSTGVSTEAEARQAVIDAKQSGADFVKVYTFLPREEYFAIVDESRKQGIPFAGHVPLSVSAEEASNAGQRSFEHLLGILPACSTRNAELAEADREDLADAISGKEHALFASHATSLRQVRLDTYSPEKAATLFAVLKKNGTWQCPTLTVLRSLALIDDASLTDDPRMKYMPRWARALWSPSSAAEMYGKHPPGDLALAKKEFGLQLRVVGAMQRARGWNPRGHRYHESLLLSRLQPSR
ncbi:MAG TPA: hypothetical protein VKV39_18295 [Candidatus Sulfotelmatobacter sp.]|nr:hypothetical protein [Candidatus Sulfotelmatobacter sp.]